MSIDYVRAVSLIAPEVQVFCQGDLSNYASLVWSNPADAIAKDVLDTYIAENPNYKDILNSNAEVLSLNNGMPAYYHGDILLSVANVTYTFGAKSSSTKNIFLNRYEGITSNLVGAVMPRNAIILNATCAIQSPVNSCGFRIYVNGMPVYREDGKVLKGPDYFAPNLEKVYKETR